MLSNHIRPLIVLLAAALFMLQCTKGDDEKKDDEKPDANYTGKLLLTYARDFPDFYATVSIDVDVYESGDVLFSSPSQVPYHGVEEKPVGDTKVKIDETGTITVTSLSGTWKKIDGVAYLEVSSNTLIDGTSQVWTWVDNSWYQVLNEPFTLENPVDPPFLFSVTDANLGAGSSVGGTAVGAYGSATFTWTLTLLVSLVP